MTEKLRVIRLDIVYCDKGDCIPDWQVENLVRHELNCLQVCVVNNRPYETYRYYANWLVIDMYRALIHSGFPELKNHVIFWWQADKGEKGKSGILQLKTDNQMRFELSHLPYSDLMVKILEMLLD